MKLNKLILSSTILGLLLFSTSACSNNQSKTSSKNSTAKTSSKVLKRSSKSSTDANNSDNNAETKQDPITSEIEYNFSGEKLYKDGEEVDNDDEKEQICQVAIGINKSKKIALGMYQGKVIVYPIDSNDTSSKHQNDVNKLNDIMADKEDFSNLYNRQKGKYGDATYTDNDGEYELHISNLPLYVKDYSYNNQYPLIKPSEKGLKKLQKVANQLPVINAYDAPRQQDYMGDKVTLSGDELDVSGSDSSQYKVVYQSSGVFTNDKIELNSNGKKLEDFTVPGNFEGVWEATDTEDSDNQFYFKVTRNGFAISDDKHGGDDGFQIIPLKRGTYKEMLNDHTKKPWERAWRSGKRIVTIPNGGGDGYSFYRSGQYLMITAGTIGKDGMATKDGTVTIYRGRRV